MGAFCIIKLNRHTLKEKEVVNMSEFKNNSSESELAASAIKYGAWLLGLIIVLYFISRNVFPFIRSLF
jgi:hypothetical protein